MVTPLSLEENQHGHWVVTVISDGPMASAEIRQLDERGFRLHEGARRVLRSTHEGSSYDSRHRLEAQRIYRIPFIPSRDLKEPQFSRRTTENFLALGKQFGYQQPRAGLQLALHKLFSQFDDEKLSRLRDIFGEIYYVGTLHVPIIDDQNNSNLLYSRLYPDGLGLNAIGGSPLHEWHDPGIFAFWDP